MEGNNFVDLVFGEGDSGTNMFSKVLNQINDVESVEN
jgi:hypothetical protein